MLLWCSSISLNFTKLMNKITELSSLLPDLFTARNVAEDTFHLGDRHSALEATCRCRASVNVFYRLRLVFKYLSVNFSYAVSLTTCRVRCVEPVWTLPYNAYMRTFILVIYFYPERQYINFKKRTTISPVSAVKSTPKWRKCQNTCT